MPRSLPFALLVLLSQPLLAADWPQFRGPGSGGKAQSPAPLPTDIAPDKHVLWKTALPLGHSSPVIVAGKIFLTAVRDNEHLETLCLDRATGKILWRVEAPHLTLEQIHGIGSYAQPSAAADAERVVVLFGSCGLFCYDHAGKLLWQQPMGPFNDEFGAAASPILAGDRVIVAQDHDTGSFVAAYDKRTGQEIWRTDRAEFSRGYATPVVWTVEGKQQVVVAGTLRVVGYDLESGRELWTVRGLSRVVCASPVVGEDNTLVVAAWSAGGEPGERISLEPFADFLAQFDENKNGTLEASEVGSSAALKTRFAQCDRDKDGHITRQEYDEFQMLFDKSQNAVLAIRPGGRGDVSQSHVRWKYEKFVPFVASPLVYQGRVYTVKDGGILTCLDAASGKPLKSGRVMGTGNYYASPAGGDGKVYLLSQRGTLSVVADSDQWEVIHSAEFGEEVYGSPALVDGRIFLRTSGHLYCFGLDAAAGN
jgi:outer membrane protein assembly factor BamB